MLVNVTRQILNRFRLNACKAKGWWRFIIIQFKKKQSNFNTLFCTVKVSFLYFTVGNFLFFCHEGVWTNTIWKTNLLPSTPSRASCKAAQRNIHDTTWVASQDIEYTDLYAHVGVLYDAGAQLPTVGGGERQHGGRYAVLVDGRGRLQRAVHQSETNITPFLTKIYFYNIKKPKPQWMSPIQTGTSRVFLKANANSMYCQLLPAWWYSTII